METLIIITFLVILIVMVLVFAQQKIHQRYEFKHTVHECKPPLRDFPGQNQYIKYMSPFDDIEIDSYGQRYLAQNEALVIYGSIPFRYLMWSINGYEFSPEPKILNTCVSGSILYGENNDGVAAVLCSDKNMFRLVHDHMHQLWRIDNPTYKMTVMPIYINDYDPRKLYTLAVKVGLRHPDEVLPPFKTVVYTSSDVKIAELEVPIPRQILETPREIKAIQPQILDESIPKLLQRGNFIVIRQLDVMLVVDDDEVLKFRSETVTLEVGQQIIAFGIDHSKACKSLLSMITAYDSSNQGLKTILTGDAEVRGIPQKSGVRVGFFDYTQSGQTVYLEEAIYPEMSKGFKFSDKGIHQMYAFICQI